MGFFSALGGTMGAIGGSASSLLGSAFQYFGNRRLMRYAYDLNQRSLKNSPSSLREGLVAAGYNPLLALGGVSNAPTVSGTSIGSPSIDAVGSAKEGALLGAVVGKALADKKTAQAEAEATTSESEARKTEAELAQEEAQARLDALRGVTEVSGDSSARSALRREYVNSLERSAYTNSKEHAIAEDAVNAIHGGSSAFQAISGGRRDWIRSSKGR